MSRDIRKLSSEKQQNSNKTVYFELNKSPFTAASLPNQLPQQNPLLQPSGGGTLNIGVTAAISSKLSNSTQPNEFSVPSSPFQPENNNMLRNSRQKVKSNATVHATHPTQTMGLGSFNIQERPASRIEINSLEGTPTLRS